MVEVSYVKSKKKKDRRYKIKKNGKEKIVKIKGKPLLTDLMEHIK